MHQSNDQTPASGRRRRRSGSTRGETTMSEEGAIAPATGQLTLKQLAFVKAYLANRGNGTQAAIEAGYSKKSAHAIASENLRNL